MKSVTFNVTANYFITNQINNTSAQNAAGTRFRTEYTVALDAAPGSPFDNTLGSFNLLDSFNYSGAAFNLHSHTVSNLGVQATINSGAIVYSVAHGDDLSAFSNAPSLLFNANSSASAVDTTTVIGEQAQLTYEAAAMTLTVTYDYTGTAVVDALPEPSPGILFGVGGLACCGWQLRTRRRRTRKSVADSVNG